MNNNLKDRISVSSLNFIAEVRESMKPPKEVIIHDTTLREGEQAPGVVFRPEDKLEIAKKLDQVGIQQIEAGFPAASEGERRALKILVKEGLRAKIFGFARAVRSDIDEVISCDAFGIVLSFSPSDIHLQYKLKLTREQYLKRAVEMVSYAKEHGLYVAYSAEDSTRTNLNFLIEVFKKVAEAGGDRARVVDTLGCIHPMAMRHLIRQLKKNLLTNMVIEVHCHNDHGLALANTLASIEEGASVVSSSVNGLGERTGITPTEEVIISLNNLYGIEGFRTEYLYELCKLVERLSRMKIHFNKPVVGDGVFTHVSGIHQDAVSKNPITYEPYPPELVGQRRRFLVGKLSGRHGIKAKLKELGVDVDEEELSRIVEAIKSYSEERRSPLTDEEVLNIVNSLRERCRLKPNEPF